MNLLNIIFLTWLLYTKRSYDYFLKFFLIASTVIVFLNALGLLKILDYSFVVFILLLLNIKISFSKG